VSKRDPSAFPPLLAVTGSETLLRMRFLKEMREAQRAAGWSVVEVDGSDAVAVRDALEGDLFSGAKTLAVVENPSDVDLDLLKRHHEAAEYGTTLLLHVESKPDGRTKFGQFVSKLGKMLKDFPKPTEWKAPEVAAEFVQQELRTYGFTIRPALAAALVARVTTDLGMLAFEVQKIALLAQSWGVSEIDGVLVRGAMAPIAEAAVAPLAEALASRNRDRVSRELVKIRATSKYDPTIRIVRLLGSSVVRWMQAAHLDSLPPKAAAAELNMNPWYFETKILPSAKRWGKAGTIRLVRDLAAAERAVFNGAISPWTVLSVRLLAACGGSDPKPQNPRPVVKTPKPESKFVVPTFLSKTDDEGFEVLIDPEILDRCSDFADELWKRRKDSWGARGPAKRADTFYSKVVEFAGDKLMRTKFGLPPAEIDMGFREDDHLPKWQGDMIYPGGVHIHVKSTATKFQWGYALILQWAKIGEAQIKAADMKRGCDDLFTMHTLGAEWVQLEPWKTTDAAKKRLVIRGTPVNDRHNVLFGVADLDNRKVTFHFLLPWRHLLENDLVERTMRQQTKKNADPKASVYLTNARYVAGLVDTPVETIFGVEGD